MKSETWIEDSKPMWHPKCRNSYTIEKSFLCAEKKRKITTVNVTHVVTKGSRNVTRSHVPKFHAKLCALFVVRHFLEDRDQNVK